MDDRTIGGGAVRKQRGQGVDVEPSRVSIKEAHEVIGGDWDLDRWLLALAGHC